MFYFYLFFKEICDRINFFLHNALFQRKVLFKCSHVKAREIQCKAQLQIVYESENLYRIQENDSAHTCIEMSRATLKKTPLSEQVIDRIRNLFRSNTRMPMRVLRVLKEDYERNDIEYQTEPTLLQIKYQIQKYRDEEFGGGEISLGNLKTFLKNNSTVPLGFDDPFVLDFKVKLGKKNTLKTSDDESDDEEEEEENSSFWFLMTTRRLLNIMNATELLAADSTFKLVWQGYPGIQIGTVDMQKQYHKICFGITSSEKTTDWIEMFEVIYLLLLYKSYIFYFLKWFL